MFALLSRYFNGYDAQRLELALDCRAGKTEKPFVEEVPVDMNSADINSVLHIQRRESATDSEEKLYQFLPKASPPCRKSQPSIFPSPSNR